MTRGVDFAATERFDTFFVNHFQPQGTDHKPHLVAIMQRSPYAFALSLFLSLAVALPLAIDPAAAQAKTAKHHSDTVNQKPKTAAHHAKPAKHAGGKHATTKKAVRHAAAKGKPHGRRHRAAALRGAATAAYHPVHASVLMDAGTGRILEASNADELTYPASLTKMMTLLLTFEALDKGTLRLDQELPVSFHAANQKPSRLGLTPGSTLRVEQAIIAITVKSANDAAVVLGEALGGTEEHFAEMMTAKARAIGMTNTTFRNASGLPNREQRTTAHDMARLSRAIVTLPAREYGYFSQTRFDWNGTTIGGHNHLLGRVAGYDGIKTGFINLSGFNLAGSAVRNGQRLIAVVLGGTSIRSRDHEVTELLEKGFKTLPAKQTASVDDARLAQAR